MLDKISTKAPKHLNKEEFKLLTQKNYVQINERHNILYAQKKFSLLLVFQGVDASGKDGAIRSVCKAFNPLGFRVFSYKKPTEIELAHDFLWRIHANAPEKGMVHMFNRSHYEDILVPSVEKYIPKSAIKERFRLINYFEDLLLHNDTILCKFYLHVSREEQLSRLQERIQLKEKHWKHNDGDWNTREKWDSYQQVYQDIFEGCNKVKWDIIPSDQNWYKDYLISEHILETLNHLPLQWPDLESELFK